jgi:putative ABC transport system permease protein
MTALALDLHLAVRRLLRRPGFTAIVVLSLSLGIGANAVIFSLAQALLRSATPYPDPDRVAAVWFTPPNNPGARILATHANCAALRERARSFQHLGCVLPDTTTSLAPIAGDASSAIAGATRIAGQEFTAGVGDALGVPLVLGRWFTLEEEQRAEPVIVISHRVWRQRFGGAPDVIGRQVRATNEALTSEVVTIIGVAPDGFQLFNSRTDYWLPFVAPPGGRASPARRLLVIGRLNPGITIPRVQAEVNAIAAALAKETPFTNQGWGLFVEAIPETVQGGVARPLRILQGVTALVLLIACGNVAGLLLADGAARRGEMAVRSALGASRWRIVRQWLTESVLTSMLGAALGLVFAWSGLRVLLHSLPAGIPGLDAVSLNARVLAFTAILSVLTALIFGIAPAVHASRQGAAEALKKSARSVGGRASGHRLRSAFVVSQIALALVLSIGAGLLIRSLMHLRAVDIGVDTGSVMTFQVQFGGREYIRDTGGSTPSGAARTQLTPRLLVAAEQIQQRLAALPGVQAASAMSATPPLSGFARRYAFDLPGSETPRANAQRTADWFPVLSDYFRTLGVPILQGRDFNTADTGAGLPVAVVSRALADELWPGQDPIGREIQMRLFNEPRRQVVGVVADVRQSTRLEGAPRQIYFPFAQLPEIQSGVVARGLEILTFVVRFSGDASPLSPAFREIVAEIDPTEPVTDIQPLERYVSNQLGGFRQYAMLLALFGTVAVTLAVVGAYGLMAHTVSQRTHEIGIRMALGATSGQTLLLILRRGIVLTAAGLVIGTGAALTVTRVLESFLWEVTPTDPFTFGMVPSALAAVCLLACYTAARRALTIDPAAAIREE